MKFITHALVWIVAVAPLTSGAALQVEAGASRDVLTGVYTDWRSAYFDASLTTAPRRVVYGSVRTTERFNLHDSELLAGAYFPMHTDWTLLVEANGSATHAVLPRGSGLIQIERSFAAGLGAQLGLRRTEYNDAGLSQEIVTLERYFGSQYAGYTLYAGQLEGGGTPTSQRLQWRYYYDDASHVALSYARGVEVENLSYGRTLTSGVRTAALAGRHRLTPHWAASFELLHHQQGTSYVRRGLRLGFRFQY